MGRKPRHRRHGSPPPRGSMESRALIRGAQSPGIYYALPLLRDLADNEPLTTYRGRKRYPPSIPRDQASDVLHAASRYSCRSEKEGTTWELPYRPHFAVETFNATLPRHTSRAESSTAMASSKLINESAYHRSRRSRPTITKDDKSRAAAGRPVPEINFIKEELIEEEPPRKHLAKRQRANHQDITSNKEYANTAVDTGARLSDHFQSSEDTHPAANEPIADQADRVSQDVNQLFVRTGNLLQTAQNRVAALELALARKVQEADDLKTQVVRLSADLEIEKMNAKRAQEDVAKDDKIIAAAKALVESDFKDMGVRMQELAEAVQGGA